MLTFNARLDMLGYNYLPDAGKYEITVSFYDALGLFYGDQIEPGFIIYVNGRDSGYPLIMKYVVDSVVDKSDPMNIILDISYLEPVDVGGPFEPIGTDFIIGKPNPVGAIQIPDASTQGLTSYFITAVVNYQSSLTGAGTSNIITDESGLVGDIDGINNIFYTPYTYIVDSVAIHYNGIRLKYGEDRDYVLQDTTTILLNFIPEIDSHLIVDYIRQT